MPDAGKPSLRTRLVQHVMLPLALTWLTGTVMALLVANYFTELAFDRALLDDAYSVAANVREHAGQLELGLSPREVGAVLFDQVETVFFAVTKPDGSLVAGHAGLVGPKSTAGTAFEFSDITFQGKDLRAVTLHQDANGAKFDVLMAQSTLSRSALLRRLLAYSIVPQLVLLLLVAWWLRRSIQEDLRPLGRLQLAMDQRDALDLTPVEVSGTTRDTQRLGTAFNSLLGRIDFAVQAQREFAGNVAHELRTPLAGIRALAEYGLAQKNPEVWREQLQRISASEERASHMVNQLLSLALADEAGFSVQLTPLLLDELVRSLVLRFMDRADQAGVDLGARGLEEPILILGNAAFIEGILGNLIDNALRYGRTSGEPGARFLVGTWSAMYWTMAGPSCRRVPSSSSSTGT